MKVLCPPKTGKFYNIVKSTYLKSDGLVEHKKVMNMTILSNKTSPSMNHSSRQDTVYPRQGQVKWQAAVWSASPGAGQPRT